VKALKAIERSILYTDQSTSLQEVQICTTFLLQLRISNAVAIGPGHSDQGCNPETEYARATPLHGGSTWFSDVAIAGETGDDETFAEWFGRLCLLFTCTDQFGVERYLAFVKYFRVTNNGVHDPLTECQRLKVERINRPHVGRVVRYDVVEVANLLCVIHVVPPLEEERPDTHF
jgi:hypothetical protein